MKNFIVIVLVALTTGISCKNTGTKNDQQAQTVYTCPMHPEVKNDEPGNCPKCGMDLVKKDEHHPDSSSNVDDEIQ